MDEQSKFLIICTPVIIAAYLFWMKLTNKKFPANELLNKQAIKRGGSVKRNFAGNDTLFFSYNNYKISVQLCRSKQRESTIASIDTHPSALKKSGFEIHNKTGILKSRIYENDFFRLISGLPSGKIIESGVTDFDQAFKIAGNNKAAVSNFLSPEIRTALLNYKDPGEHFSLTVSKNKLTLKLSRWLKDEAETDHFIELILLICGKLNTLS